jgi:pimeloyl-ACP methyl ester carboxylesterase
MGHHRLPASVLKCAVIVLATLLGGCAYVWQPTRVPMRMTSVSADCAQRADTLVVMLPGSYSLAEEYVDKGFLEAARQDGIKVDWLLVDAHVGYYRERSIIVRLHDDVVAPARDRGYRHIWLVGISIGAFGALIYDEDHPDDIDGIIAIAPYLGMREIAEQIADSGGLAQWRAPVQRPPADEIDQRLWRGLQARLRPGGRDEARPLFLGYGTDDRFIYNDDVLAAALPAGRVYTAPGDHDWPVWKVLWRDMLPALPLPRDANCRGG